MSDMLVTTAYLTMEPTFRGGKVVGFRVTKVTQKRPTGRTPTVRLTLRIAARAFAPLAPDVTIEVPEDSLSWPEPEVTVVPEPEA